MREAAPHPSEIWTPLPSEFPLPSVERWAEYGYFLELRNAKDTIACISGVIYRRGRVRFLAAEPLHLRQNCEGFSNTHLQDNLL